MEISTKHSTTSNYTSLAKKAGNTASGDSVEIGTIVIDNTSSMEELLKKKGYDADGYKNIKERIFDAGIGLTIGGVVGTIGTAVVAKALCGAGGLVTLGLSLLGGAVGTIAGGIIEFHVRDYTEKGYELI